MFFVNANCVILNIHVSDEVLISMGRFLKSFCVDAYSHPSTSIHTHTSRYQWYYLTLAALQGKERDAEKKLKVFCVLCWKDSDSIDMAAYDIKYIQVDTTFSEFQFWCLVFFLFSNMYFSDSLNHIVFFKPGYRIYNLNKFSGWNQFDIIQTKREE